MDYEACTLPLHCATIASPEKNKLGCAALTSLKKLSLEPKNLLGPISLAFVVL